MLDEEKKALDNIKSLLLYSKEHEYFSPFQEQEIDDMNIVLNLIEKQSKEIEELKDDRKKYAEEYIHNNPWLYKQLNEVYILRKESEQKERKAWIKGTNDADELCNKKWEDKIKAKIEEVNNEELNPAFIISSVEYKRDIIKYLQSLLEKE